MRKPNVLLGVVILIGLIAGQAAAVDPVVYLPFEGDLTNQGTGGSAYDAAIVQGDTGGYSFVAGPGGLGQSLNIDNTGSLKTGGTYLAVDYTLPDQGSIALWYYAEPFYNYQSVYDNATASPEHWEMWIYNDGRLRTRPNNNHPLYGYDGAQVTANLNTVGGAENWYHIAYTWDRYDSGRDATKLYVNGRLADFNYMAWSDPGPTFYLAGGNDGNTYGNGAWDDVRIYDAVLDVATIEQLAGVGPPVPVTVPDPVIHYDFQGDIVNRGTGGSAYDGTLSLGSNGSAEYVGGVLGQGLKLDDPNPTAGDGAYVTVPYTLPEEGTISMVFKASRFYNYLSLFDSPVEANDWEAWIYSNGNIRARIDNGQGDIQFSTIAFEGGVDQWLHICYAWSLEDGVASMYINGRYAGSGAISSQGWITPGSEFYIAGGNRGNHSGIGIFDEFMVFEESLSLEQVRALNAAIPEPGIPLLLVLAMISAVAGGRFRRNRI